LLQYRVKKQRTKMKIEQKVKFGMSVALASLLSLGLTGCGIDSDTAATGVTGTDVTVERGKVFDANVTDSSTPAQVATQKTRQNVYTFAKAPTYPIIVNGGWIDVNDNGLMDVNDTKLDIEMRSYTPVVTPVTTYIADANETLREQKLAELVAQLNTSGVGADANVTAEDLLKVPSVAPRDVMIVSNAIFKDMKEKATLTPAIADVMSQFGTIDGALAEGTTSVDAEQAVLAVLETTATVTKVTLAELSLYEQNVLGQAMSPIAKGIIDGTITSDHWMLNAVHTQYTTDFLYDTFGFIGEWRVEGNTLTLSGADGDKTEIIFESANPTDGSSITIKGYYGDTVDVTTSYTITVLAPEPVIPDTNTTTGGDTTTPPTTMDLSAYSHILIYKNISSTIVSSLTSAYATENGFTSTTTTSSASCTDYGFSNPTISSNVKAYVNLSTYNSCSEIDYAGVSGASGTSNALVYYGN
jgi:hypothetical protein